MKTCQHCNMQNEDSAKFCEKCGSVLTDTLNTPSVSHEPVSQGLKIGIIILSVLIPLVGLIMGGIYFTNKDPEKKKVGRTWLWAAGGGILLYLLVYGE